MLTLDRVGIAFAAPSGALIPVVEDLSLRIDQGASVGLVGESGSGKTILCRAILGTVRRHGARITSGRITFDGLDLTAATDDTWRQVRGAGIAYVPQSSLASLNPVLTIEHQLALVLRAGAAGRPLGRHEMHRRSLELLDAVEIADPRAVLALRPHQLSGGMRQRVVIAIAISRSPRLLVADEPTTALDVRVQRRILDLLATLRQRLGSALLLVSHDVAVIEEMCDEVVVMYAGSVTESGRRDLVLERPVHPYTSGLIGAAVGRAPGHASIPGEVPAVGAWPTGCRFAPRCARSAAIGGGTPDSICTTSPPPEARVVDDRMVACHFVGTFDGRAVASTSVDSR